MNVMLEQPAFENTCFDIPKLEEMNWLSVDVHTNNHINEIPESWVNEVVCLQNKMEIVHRDLFIIRQLIAETKLKNGKF